MAGGFERLDVRTDIGKLLESWVFGELHKRFPEPGAVRYWRTRNGAEVDFVLGPPDEARIGIEVKATERARPRLTRSARSFLEAYEPAELWLVSRAEPHEETPGRTRLRWIPAELLPDAIADLPDP